MQKYTVVPSSTPVRPVNLYLLTTVYSYCMFFLILQTIPAEMIFVGGEQETPHCFSLIAAGGDLPYCYW